MRARTQANIHTNAVSQRRRRCRRRRWRLKTISRIRANCCCCGSSCVISWLGQNERIFTEKYINIRVKLGGRYIFCFTLSVRARIRAKQTLVSSEWNWLMWPWSDNDDSTVSFFLSIHCASSSLHPFHYTDCLRSVVRYNDDRTTLFALWSGFNCSFMSNVCVSVCLERVHHRSRLRFSLFWRRCRNKIK